MIEITSSFLVGLLWYAAISIVSILVGAGLSYIFNISKLLGTYNAHDMGLGNLFLSAGIFSLLGQILSIAIFFHSNLIFVIAIVVIINIIILIKFI